MKKKRWRAQPNKGYYFINIFGEVQFDRDYRITVDDAKYDSGNYFHTKEEAEAMANKLRAVLKGADVIEMPSEEEFMQLINEAFPYNGGTKGLICESGIADWLACYNYLKSKTIK